MATEVKLPRLGQGMESGTIVKWLKSEGEAVEKGEPLYERDTELSQIRGTGPDGRIVAEDVERAQAQPATAAAPVAQASSGEVESRPLSSVRKTIARRLTQAWTVPAFQLTVDADMTRATE